MKYKRNKWNVSEVRNDPKFLDNMSGQTMQTQIRLLQDILRLLQE